MRRMAVVAGVMAVAGAVYVVVAGHQPVVPDQPRNDLLTRLMFPEDTRYSPDFSEGGFTRIHKGMTIEEVSAMLGQPLEIAEVAGLTIVRTFSLVNGQMTLVQETPHDAPVDRVVYSYSQRGPRFESYFVRNVIFDGASGRVARVVGEFNAD